MEHFWAVEGGTEIGGAQGLGLGVSGIEEEEKIYLLTPGDLQLQLLTCLQGE